MFEVFQVRIKNRFFINWTVVKYDFIAKAQNAHFDQMKNAVGDGEFSLDFS